MATDLFGPALAAGGVTTRPAETRLFNPTDTFWKDCSSEEADDGTEWQAAVMNQFAAMIRRIARGNGQTTVGAVDIVTEDNADDDILLKAIQHLFQRGIPAYADAAGTANAITIALTPALAEYKKGFRVWTKILATNTTAAVTVNINALGDKALKTVNGADPGIGACPIGAMMCFEYDGTNFQIISTLGAAAFSQPRCTITTAAIPSLAASTATVHGMSVASHNDMGVSGPVISGGNSVILPAGTYAFQIFDLVTCGNVVTTTQVAMQTALLKNGVAVQYGFETTHLLTSQNVTVAPGFAGTVTVDGDDTLQVASTVGTTLGAHFSSGSAAAGYVTFQRIG